MFAMVVLVRFHIADFLPSVVVCGMVPWVSCAACAFVPLSGHVWIP